MSLEAASLVAKGPVKVDVSTLKQLPTDQMEFFGKTVEVSYEIFPIQRKSRPTEIQHTSVRSRVRFQRSPFQRALNSDVVYSVFTKCLLGTLGAILIEEREKKWTFIRYTGFFYFWWCWVPTNPFEVENIIIEMNFIHEPIKHHHLAWLVLGVFPIFQ